MNSIKAALALIMLAAASFILVGSSQDLQAQGSGTCIFAEQRSVLGYCFGPTTRLCEGPPECLPPDQ